MMKFFNYTKITEQEQDEDLPVQRERLPSIIKNFEQSGNKRIRESVSDLAVLLETHNDKKKEK